MEHNRRKLRLGDLLVDAGVINQAKLEKALAMQKGAGKRLGEVLVENGFVTEEAIARALSEQLNFGLIDLQSIEINDQALQLFKNDFLKKARLIPFEFSDKEANVIKVAMADPLDIQAVDDVELITNMRVEQYVATPYSVMTAYDKLFGNDDAANVAELYAQSKEDEEEDEEDFYSEDINNSPIVILVKDWVSPEIHVI